MYLNNMINFEMLWIIKFELSDLLKLVAICGCKISNICEIFNLYELSNLYEYIKLLSIHY